MYQAHYINPLKQLGQISFDLILTDDEGVLPEVRVSKSFPDDITEDDLIQHANTAIASLLVEQVLPPQDSVSPDVDLPKGEVLL